MTGSPCSANIDSGIVSSSQAAASDVSLSRRSARRKEAGAAATTVNRRFSVSRERRHVAPTRHGRERRAEQMCAADVRRGGGRKWEREGRGCNESVGDH